ncbi:MAG: hypothetical protein RR441_05815 [Longicatena sp.]
MQEILYEKELKNVILMMKALQDLLLYLSYEHDEEYLFDCYFYTYKLLEMIEDSSYEQYEYYEKNIKIDFKEIIYKYKENEWFTKRINKNIVFDILK